MGVLAVMLVSVWSMMWVSSERTRTANEADIIEKSIEDKRKAHEERLKEEEKRKQEEQAVVISDSDRYQLAAARLLLQRKSLSWTRMLSDLEHYVPNDTRVTGIKVESVDESGRAIIARIEVKAAGKTPGEMTAMMNLVDKSNGVFELGQVTQESVMETGETPFTVNLVYRLDRGEQR